MNLLSFILLVPILGSILLTLIPKNNLKLIKVTSLIFSIATFGLIISLLNFFDFSLGTFQFEESYLWLPLLNSSFHLGIDGISFSLLLLTGFLMPIVIFSAFNSISKNIKQFYSLLLLLEFAIIGVFISLDSIVFYIFWELILIPMYFIIGIWGGKDRIYATVKFFIFTFLGSLIMLVGIIWLGNHLGSQLNIGFVSDLNVIYQNVELIPNSLQITLFWMFAISFLIKIPVFPLHTWLPDAHTEAPTAGSIILAGVLLKMGTYGLMRFNIPIFPHASIISADLMALIAVIGIIYGGLAAMIQKDMKRLVAYSSVAHMGFILLGIFAFNIEGWQGATLQMINHGLSTGLLFLLVGFVYDQRHTREISDYGGIAKIVPNFSVVFAIAMFASIGLPGLNGFVGEFYTLIGAFGSKYLSSNSYAIFGTLGVIIAAVYMLWMYKRVFFGTVTKSENSSIHDLKWKNWIIILPFLILIVIIGFYPKPFLSITDATVKSTLSNIELIINK